MFGLEFLCSISSFLYLPFFLLPLSPLLSFNLEEFLVKIKTPVKELANDINLKTNSFQGIINNTAQKICSQAFISRGTVGVKFWQANSVFKQWHGWHKRDMHNPPLNGPPLECYTHSFKLEWLWTVPQSTTWPYCFTATFNQIIMHKGFILYSQLKRPQMRTIQQLSMVIGLNKSTIPPLKLEAIC